MKLTKVKLGMLLLSGTLLTGCSSDNLVNGEPEVVDKDTKFYINVEIANPAENTTRADGESTVGNNTNEDNLDYSNGTGDEAKIYKILFVFYNSNYQYVDNTEITVSTDGTNLGNGITGGPQTGNGTLETILTLTVDVDVSTGNTKPAYVMAYVNPATGHNDRMNDFGKNLALARRLDEMVPYTGKDGYTMTNSVYYEGESGKQPVIAVPIGDNLFATEEEANNASDDKKIKIYVERVVAKVNLNKIEKDFTQDLNTIKDQSGTEYKLDFEPLAWGLSNLEKATFLTKNFRRSTNAIYDDTKGFFSNLTSVDNMTYEIANGNDMFGSLSSPKWNFPSTTVETDNWGISGRRSFWAVSPSYFPDLSLYPGYAEEYEGNEHKYALDYVSFNDIYDTNAAKVGKNGKSFSKDATSLYTLEHTMMPIVVTNQQKRGVTCALVVGRYKILEKLETAESGWIEKTYNEGDKKDFFIINRASSSVLYPTERDMKIAFLAANSTIYIKNANYDATTAGSKEYVPVTASGEDAGSVLANFDIYHPDKSITGIYIPSRYASIKLNKVPGSGASGTETSDNVKYFYPNANGIMTEITADNLKTANIALYENLQNSLGGVEKYTAGYAYFSVPIMHLWKRGENDKQIGEEGFAASLGQYGIVRNHIYNITVSGISGIGTAIQNPDHPIIPNVEKERYYVRTEMRVQRWRIVPVQNVILKP